MLDCLTKQTRKSCAERNNVFDNASLSIFFMDFGNPSRMYVRVETDIVQRFSSSYSSMVSMNLISKYGTKSFKPRSSLHLLQQGTTLLGLCG